MDEEQISTGHTVGLQGIIFFFAILFAVALMILFRSSSLAVSGWILLALIYVCIFLVLARLFSFADIYIKPGYVIIKKITETVKKPVTRIKSINKGSLPFIFYIEFDDRKKVYFRFKPEGMTQKTTEADIPKMLGELKARLNIK